MILKSRLMQLDIKINRLSLLKKNKKKILKKIFHKHSKKCSLKIIIGLEANIIFIMDLFMVIQQNTMRTAIIKVKFLKLKRNLLKRKRICKVKKKLEKFTKRMNNFWKGLMKKMIIMKKGTNFLIFWNLRKIFNI